MTRLEARLHEANKTETVLRAVVRHLGVWISFMRRRLVVFADTAILVAAACALLLRLGYVDGS